MSHIVHYDTDSEDAYEPQYDDPQHRQSIEEDVDKDDGYRYDFNQFELDTILSLICKNEHLNGGGDGLYFATRVNEALNPNRRKGRYDNFDKDIDKDEIIRKLEEILTTKNLALKAISKHFPHRITRSQKLMFLRNTSRVCDDWKKLKNPSLIEEEERALRLTHHPVTKLHPRDARDEWMTRQKEAIGKAKDQAKTKRISRDRGRSSPDVEMTDGDALRPVVSGRRDDVEMSDSQASRPSSFNPDHIRDELPRKQQTVHASHGQGGRYSGISASDVTSSRASGAGINSNGLMNGNGRAMVQQPNAYAAGPTGPIEPWKAQTQPTEVGGWAGGFAQPAPAPVDTQYSYPTTPQYNNTYGESVDAYGSAYGGFAQQPHPYSTGGQEDVDPGQGWNGYADQGADRRYPAPGPGAGRNGNQ